MPEGRHDVMQCPYDQQQCESPGCHDAASARCDPLCLNLRPSRPLFIPLRGEYFDAFAAGIKREELRRYGPRWNERTCRVGRRVVLSRGYGRHYRLIGEIVRFTTQRGSTFGSTYRTSIERLYRTLDIDIACIEIEVGR